MKLGVVDVGGGLRGIYAAGVFDYCMEKNIDFHLCIGVSAGSANVASYVSGQQGRNYKFYTEYAMRKKYMSLRNFITKKNYVDLDYIYSDLSNSNGENPLDYRALKTNDKDLLIVATEAHTGRAKYFSKKDINHDQYDVLKASCAIPFACEPYEISNTKYYDGGIADPIPVQKAFDEGCDKVVVILTKPERPLEKSKRDRRIAKIISKKYPEAAYKLGKRVENYNRSFRLAKKYEEKGKVLIVAPDNTCGMKTLTRDVDALQTFYKKGYRDAKKIEEFIKEN